MFFIRENKKDIRENKKTTTKLKLASKGLLLSCSFKFKALCYGSLCTLHRILSIILWTRCHYFSFTDRIWEYGMRLATRPPGKKKNWNLNPIYFDSCCWAAYCPISQKNPGVPFAIGRTVALFSYRQKDTFVNGWHANTGWGAVRWGNPWLSQALAGDISTCLCRLHLCFSIVFSQSMVIKASLYSPCEINRSTVFTKSSTWSGCCCSLWVPWPCRQRLF